MVDWSFCGNETESRIIGCNIGLPLARANQPLLSELYNAAKHKLCIRCALDERMQYKRPISENSSTVAKNVADISYTSRVIANSVPNFVAMATGIGQRKMRLATKTPYRHKNLAEFFYTSRIIANFVLNFVAMATGISRGKCDWRRSMAHPRKTPIGAKISPKSLMQAQL